MIACPAWAGDASLVRVGRLRATWEEETGSPAVSGCQQCDLTSHGRPVRTNGGVPNAWQERTTMEAQQPQVRPRQGGEGGNVNRCPLCKCQMTGSPPATIMGDEETKERRALSNPITQPT